MEGEEEEEGETHGRRYGTRVVGGVSFDLFFLHRFLFFPTRPPPQGEKEGVADEARTRTGWGVSGGRRGKGHNREQRQGAAGKKRSDGIIP